MRIRIPNIGQNTTLLLRTFSQDNFFGVKIFKWSLWLAVHKTLLRIRILRICSESLYGIAEGELGRLPSRF
jgi:hypothetical protein